MRKNRKFIGDNWLNALLFILFFAQLAPGQGDSQEIITSDIDNFWAAYDKVIATKDAAKQLEYVNTMFIEKGSDGLKKIMEARRYTPQEYVDAINKYPQFWASIRANTYKSKQLAAEIQTGIEQLRGIYPTLKPAKIYFTIGVFRTGGTTLDRAVLIGSEINLADANTVTTEFPKSFDNLRAYFKTNPINSIAFNNVHEYIHTQQKTTICDNLLAQSVMEGVAEFLTVKATKLPSTAPAISYGKNNFKRVRAKFTTQMYNPLMGFWLYSNEENEFNMRDLGYYVGYEIVERYYDKAVDKTEAVKEMIELDYNNETELAKFVEKSGYFTKSLQELRKQYDKSLDKRRPTVVGIKPFKNKSQNVNPNIQQISIEFSQPLDKGFKNFDYGPLGEQNVLRLKKVIGFSEDGKKITIEVELKPDQRYQLVIGDGFRTTDGIRLKPYLIDFRTAKK